jgi:hypothetical protein
MTEIVATILIIASSTALFGYWFRYSCLLILNTRTARDYAAAVATANQLSFLEVQSRLRQRAATDLDRLRDLLDRDYAVVSYLLRHGANSSAGGASFETGMLAINYRLMKVWYVATRQLSASAACRALEEMSMVVSHFANQMGERASAGAAA